MDISSIKQAKIQYGFKKDCEKLLQDFAASKTTRFSHFATLWSDMKFSLVYAYSSSLDKITHHTQLFLFETKKYFLYSDNEFIKIAALYMLYGLYYKQPIMEHIKIRLTVYEYEKLVEFIDEMKRQENVEVVYVFSKLKHDSAFDLVYTETQSTLELAFMADLFKMKDDTFQSTALDKIESDMKKLIDNRDIKKVNDEYNQALKEYLKETNNEKSFMVCSQDLQKDIKGIMFGEEIVHEGDGDKDNIGERRIALKKKSAASSSHAYKVSKAELSPKKKKNVKK